MSPTRNIRAYGSEAQTTGELCDVGNADDAGTADAESDSEPKAGFPKTPSSEGISPIVVPTDNSLLVPTDTKAVPMDAPPVPMDTSVPTDTLVPMDTLVPTDIEATETDTLVPMDTLVPKDVDAIFDMEVPLDTLRDMTIPGRTGCQQNPQQGPLPSTCCREGSDTIGFTGLDQPMLDNGKPATGGTTPRLRIENKRRRLTKQLQQRYNPAMWTKHTGAISPTIPRRSRPQHRNTMCPTGLALQHPAAPILLDYAMNGCPVQTGKPWTQEQIIAAIKRGPHVSALVPAAMAQLDEEVQDKVKNGQARLVKWADIQHNPPPELKVSPIAMIPHKSRPYRAILDLSYSVKLSPNESIPSVNSTTIKTAPKGAIDQLGHSLQRLIYAFAVAEDDAKIFMAKWDIKDGFWRLDCRAGEEWNFAYVLPSSHGSDPILVIPTSLQMGWIESPPYFCTASETARDVAAQYANMPVGSLPPHKFLHHTQTHEDYKTLPMSTEHEDLYYMLEVFVDDFIQLAIPVAKPQLDHLASATMSGVHDVFPPHPTPPLDPISEKKLLKGDGEWALVKDLLGMTFDGTNKTICLSTDKRDAILATLKSWVRNSSKRKGVPFNEFQSMLSKIQHAFTTIPAGRGLLSPFYRVLAAKPAMVSLHRNAPLLTAVKECRTFLRDTISTPTKCKNLIHSWPDCIGITDASGHGLGGVIFGENAPVVPTVFRMEWPLDIKNDIVSTDNPGGTITNSDLEMAGLLMLWIVMESVCHPVQNKHVALFSDNSPTVHWVQRLAAKQSPIAMQLIRALALRLQLQRASPLTPLHIAGANNAMTDIPSRSFGSEPKWHCKTDADLLHLFNSSFPLPNQASWTVFHPSSAIATKLISVLRMRPFTMDDWRRLPTAGKNIGNVGKPMSHLWDWTHSYRRPHTNTEQEPCPDLQLGFGPDIMVDEDKSALARSLRLSQPLGRRYPWPRA